MDGSDARSELLARLRAEGASEEEIAAAVAENRLALLPAELRVGGGRHTARDIEAQTGVSIGLLLELRRLLGLSAVGPDDPVFTDEEVAEANSIQQFLDAGFDVETLTDITRVLGESMSRLAAAVTAATGETFIEAGDNELEVARRYETLTEQLLPGMDAVLTSTFRSHLREAIHRGMVGPRELERGHLTDATTLGVCFADMVGFTRLGGELEIQELGGVATRLANLATSRAEPPVRLVKTIGDAAMLVSGNPAALIDAALGLIADAEAAELPTLRAGIAYGEAVMRAGDYFGHSVNLASRVTGIARPGSVLCSEELREATPNEFDWSFAGRFRLKGIATPVALHRARPLGSTPEPTRRRNRG